MSSQSLCHVTGISMLRVLRTVRTPHERLETVYIRWRNNITATTRLPVCPVTQLDIWPSLREVTTMLLVFSSTMEMLNETSFIAQPRTPDRPQIHLVLAELGASLQDWLVLVFTPLPKTLWSTAPWHVCMLSTQTNVFVCFTCISHRC